MTTPERVLLRHKDGSRTPIDPADVYFLEADGGETLVRTRSAEPLIDVRPLGELSEVFGPYGFARIHRSFAVNIARVRNIRPRPTEGWELKLDPPVNRILPVAEDRTTALWRMHEED